MKRKDSWYSLTLLALSALTLTLFLAACGDVSPTAIIDSNGAIPKAATIASTKIPTLTPKPVTITTISSTIVAKSVTPILTTNTLHKGTLAQIFPQLSNLTDATAIRLQNDWYGPVLSAPWERHYILRQSGNEFKGQAILK